MKKIIIMVLFFLTDAGVVLYGTAYMVRLHNSNRYTDGPIARDSVGFYVPDDKRTTDLSFVLETEEDDFTLLVEDASIPLTYHIVFSKGDNDILSGRFLNDWDYTRPRRAAIIGENASIDGFEMIGKLDGDMIFGGSSASFLLDTDIREVPSGTAVIVASEIEGHAREVFEVLKKSAQKRGLSVKEIQLAFVAFGHYEESESKMIITILLFWCVMFVITGMAAYFWFVVGRPLYRVLLMFGAKAPLLRVYFPLVLAAILSFTVHVVLFAIIQSYSIYIIGIIFKTALLLYMGLLLSVLPVAMSMQGRR